MFSSSLPPRTPAERTTKQGQEISNLVLELMKLLLQSLEDEDARDTQLSVLLHQRAQERFEEGFTFLIRGRVLGRKLAAIWQALANI